MISSIKCTQKSVLNDIDIRSGIHSGIHSSIHAGICLQLKNGHDDIVLVSRLKFV
jgi:hypothetical protein